MMLNGVFVSMEPICCCSCGITFGIPDTFVNELRVTHAEFWCPAGHPLSFRGESEPERLARELKAERDRLAAERARHDQTRAELREEQRRLSATRGVVTRTKRRISCGVCPCCNRSFSNLRRHMQTQHTDYAAKAQ